MTIGRLKSFSVHAANRSRKNESTLAATAPVPTAGIHLAPNGSVSGTPRAGVGRYTFNVRVTDATGSLTTRRLTLRIVA